MADTADDLVRLYFSFRSPYAWLATFRLRRALGDLPVRVEYVPVYPPDEFPNDPAAIPAKATYIGRDVIRTARAYGLSVRFPERLDTDWGRPHAAFLYADHEGKGEEFALETFSARFSRGLDVGTDETLAQIAGASDLDVGETLAAAADPELQARVREGVVRAFGERGVFGVPMFAYRGEYFWGNDRLDWLIRAIRSANGLPVPDLSADPLAAPHLG